ncbi:hypothetical protein D7B24_002927 [Verticillium nonalfalfae]|uniref:Uncharacterized protein n=1 Tax=Verticillium nonalfalfae TaxID=1051616 RepID=A0A3M9XWV8_9PEZI|nr:uncharacterized protein D7B24_002927 [Verticillium nonalfalfae]RNJ52749.1 hypothetical protein D7B24_002927 [Verticillium nonalfalfae]
MPAESQPRAPKRSTPAAASLEPGDASAAQPATPAPKSANKLEMPPRNKRNLALRGSTSAAPNMWRSYHRDLKEYKRLLRKAEKKKARKKQRLADTVAAAKLQSRAAKERLREAKKAEKETEARERRALKEALREELRVAKEVERAMREKQKAERRLERQERRRAGAAGVGDSPIGARMALQERGAAEPVDETIDEEVVVDEELLETNRESRLLALPMEVREMILEHLLTTNKPIRLIEGWAKLWKGRGPQLDTAVMRTCKLLFSESIIILYGRNMFEYVLREFADDPFPVGAGNDEGKNDVASPTNNGSGDNEVAHGFPDDNYTEAGSVFAVDEDEMDDDEDNPAPLHTTSSIHPRMAPPTAGAVDIDIQKFGSLFRHLTIVAERNRTELGYLHSMADTIDVFRHLPPKPGAHIHTLSIVITPGFEDGVVTFLNFFEPDGRVVRSLRRLPCQFIRIVVHTDYSIRGGRPHTIVIDMRPLEAEKDEGEVARRRREEKLGIRRTMLQTLPKLIRTGWEAGADPDYGTDSEEELDDWEYFWFGGKFNPDEMDDEGEDDVEEEMELD